jgi:hypothetical protein
MSFGSPCVFHACLAWAPYTGELVAGESTPSGQSRCFRKRMASISNVPAIALPQEFRLQIADATQRLEEQSSLLRAVGPARDKLEQESSSRLAGRVDGSLAVRLQSAANP